VVCATGRPGDLCRRPSMGGGDVGRDALSGLRLVVALFSADNVMINVPRQRAGL